MDTPQSRAQAEDSEVRPTGTTEEAKDQPSVSGEAGTRSQDAIEGAVAPLSRGQIVEGLIVHIDEDGALVDVGTKSEGHVAAGELAGGTTEEGKPLDVGDKIAVYVVRPEDDDGRPVLSKKRADYERVWRRVIEAHDKGEVLLAMVTDRVRGGLVVDLGLRGFLPASHVRTRNVHALDRFIGQSLKVKVIEVDRARKRVVVSHKKAIEEERRRRRERTLASLEENKVYRGVVRRITDYGAFVDLGGVDGLLHITEMSWTRIDHPRDAVKVGEKMDVMILRFDREQSRISLGLKQILPDPWEDVPKNYRVGQIVHGTVTRVVPFGAFVRLETGIEGIIPNAELPGERGKRAADMLSAGQEVDVKIVNIRPPERRMTLSLRQFEQARERQRLREYMRRQEEDSRVTIGDLFGSVLAETQAARQRPEGEPERTETEADEAALPATEPTELEKTAAGQESAGGESGDEEPQARAADEAPGTDAEVDGALQTAGEEARESGDKEPQARATEAADEAPGTDAEVDGALETAGEEARESRDKEPQARATEAADEAPGTEAEVDGALETAGEEARESGEDEEAASSSSESPAESEAEKA